MAAAFGGAYTKQKVASVSLRETETHIVLLLGFLGLESAYWVNYN